MLAHRCVDLKILTAGIARTNVRLRFEQRIEELC